MRILGLVHQYVPVRCAGAETHIHAMLRSLARRGHRVDVVLSAQPGDPYTVDGVNVWPTVDHRRDVFDWLPDADLIVSHLENTTRATVLGQLNRIPVAVAHHNTFIAARNALLLHGSRTDLVAVNSEHMAATLDRFLTEQAVTGPATVIVRPAAGLDEYATVPGDRVTLVNLRRRDNRRDRDHLSKGGEIFRALAERLPDVEFLGVTGCYGTQQDLGDLANVEVIDHVPHDEMRDRVYARTRVLLVPSSYESWGRVASEAMCSGIPVIASPTPGLREQLGDAGTFADPADVDAWESALVRLLDDRGRWERCSTAAHDRAVELAHLGAQDLDGWTAAVERVVADNYERSLAAS